MADADHLVVTMGGRRIGRLERADDGRLRLVYASTWMEERAPTPLSLSLPVLAGEHDDGHVRPYLWGLFPENDRVLQRWAYEADCRVGDVFGLLAHVGSDVAGAARFLRPDVAGSEEPDGHDPCDEAAIAEMLREVVADRPVRSPSATPGRWSLAGAQAKLALAFDPVADQWSVPSGAAPTTHILKPPVEAFAQHEVNEHLCLDAASHLGLRAATSTVRRFDGERALVVERYDRVRQADGTLVRVHQEDLCQALGVPPELKYESDGGPGVTAMASVLREHVRDDAPRQIEAFCRSLAFRWLVADPDAHAKNHSVLLSGPQVRLAPMYDIATGLPYFHPRKLKLAQKIGGEYRMSVIEAKHWERLAGDVGVDPAWMHDTVVDLATRLPDAMGDAIGRTGLRGEEARFARRLHEGIVEWAGWCVRAMGRQGADA